MIDYKPVANRTFPYAAKRDFSVQMAIAVAPSIADYFLRTSDKLVKRQLANNPKIDTQDLIDYQSDLSARVRDEIHKHTVALVESFHSDYFPDVPKDQISVEGSRSQTQAVR
jgi:hypothetical protein